MIRKGRASAVLIAFLWASSSAAQTGGQMRVGFFGGIAIPSGGPLNVVDYGKIGYGFGGELVLHVAETTALGLSGSFLTLRFDDAEYESDFIRENGSYDSLVVEGGGTKWACVSFNVIQYLMSLENPVDFYFTAGGGYYRQAVDPLDGTMYKGADIPYELPGDEETVFNSRKNLIGFNGGLGVDIALGAMVLFTIEGKFHYLLTEGKRTSFVSALAGFRVTVF